MYCRSGQHVTAGCISDPTSCRYFLLSSLFQFYFKCLHHSMPRGQLLLRHLHGLVCDHLGARRAPLRIQCFLSCTLLPSFDSSRPLLVVRSLGGGGGSGGVDSLSVPLSPFSYPREASDSVTLGRSVQSPRKRMRPSPMLKGPGDGVADLHGLDLLLLAHVSRGGSPG